MELDMYLLLLFTTYFVLRNIHDQLRLLLSIDRYLYTLFIRCRVILIIYLGEPGRNGDATSFTNCSPQCRLRVVCNRGVYLYMIDAIPRMEYNLPFLPSDPRHFPMPLQKRRMKANKPQFISVEAQFSNLQMTVF